MNRHNPGPPMSKHRPLLQGKCGKHEIVNTGFQGQKTSKGRIEACLVAKRACSQIEGDAGRPVTYAWDQDAACLLMDCSRLFGWESLHAVSDWASGFLTLHCNDNQLEEGRVTDLGLPFGSCADGAFRHWFATIPRAMTEPLAQLPGRRYALVRLAQRSQSARDLIISNVNLCYLLHHFATAHGYPEGAFAELAARKQVDILREMGLPPHKRVVKLIRKIAMAEIDTFAFSRLLRVLGDETVCNALVHEQRLTRRLFLVLARYPWVAGRPLQRLLCEATDRSRREWVEDNIRMGGEEAVRTMQQFDQTSQLRRLHDRLVAAQMHQESTRPRRYDANGKVLPYPPAPFADTQSIQAIKTPDALQAETEEMAHCVSSYSERIYKGRYAVYKVLAPERLTLGLKIHDGRVSFDQLRGIANQAPSQPAQAAVEQWFRERLRGSMRAKTL